VHSYLNTTKYVDQSAVITDWFEAFITSSAANAELKPMLVRSSFNFIINFSSSFYLLSCMMHDSHMNLSTVLCRLHWPHPLDK